MLVVCFRVCEVVTLGDSSSVGVYYENGAFQGVQENRIGSFAAYAVDGEEFFP